MLNNYENWAVFLSLILGPCRAVYILLFQKQREDTINLIGNVFFSE